MFKKSKQPTTLMYEYLKGYGEQQFYDWLSPADLLSLSLASKKLYLLVSPILSARGLDQVQKQPTKKDKGNGVKNGQKNKKREEKNADKNQQEIEVEISRKAIKGCDKLIRNGNWKLLTALPEDYKNSYLQKKMDIGAHFFYQNVDTGEILFLYRALVDPNLNYNQGGFDEDLLDEEKTQMYSQMFEGDVGDLDFTSPEALMLRQKEMLAAINKKKQEMAKKLEIDYISELKKATELKKIAVILCFGGSFSFGIFSNDKCILHKSDKKYVCRKKAGERQLNRDKQGGSQIQSMGSQIRRDQEKKHIANVGSILNENRQVIESCDMVFLQAPGLNRLFVINDSETLSGVKDRLRSLCLTAKKANFTEVEAVYKEIIKVNFVSKKAP